MINKAAILSQNTVYTGRNHTFIRIEKDLEHDNKDSQIDGFITCSGQFLNRLEAYDHAFSCGQLKSGYEQKREPLKSVMI